MLTGTAHHHTYGVPSPRRHRAGDGCRTPTRRQKSWSAMRRCGQCPLNRVWQAIRSRTGAGSPGSPAVVFAHIAAHPYNCAAEFRVTEYRTVLPLSLMHFPHSNLVPTALSRKRDCPRVAPRPGNVVVTFISETLARNITAF